MKAPKSTPRDHRAHLADLEADEPHADMEGPDRPE